MIIAQLIKKNKIQNAESEKNRISARRNTKTKKSKRFFDIFSFAERTFKPKHLPNATSKYKEVWNRVRIKIREKLAMRYYKEIEFYEACAKDTFEANIRRITLMISEMKDMKVEEPMKPFYIIHPKSGLKRNWNFLMVLILLYTALIMPYRIAFIDGVEYDSWWIVDNVVNLLFFVDFLMNCFTAFYDGSSSFVTDWSAILVNYLKGWLIIDFCVCIPLDLILSAGHYNNLLRLLRLPRLYRLFKFSGIFKHLRSKQGHGLAWLLEKVNLKEAHMKIFSFFFTVIICTHVMTCLFYFAARFNNFSVETWIFKYDFIDDSSYLIYIMSMYWSYTTLTTVGYGDITPCTNIEIIMALFWMTFSVFFFSFTIGSLASMFSGIDTKEAILTKKLSQIDEFFRDSDAPNSLKVKIKSALRYSSDAEGNSWKNKNIFSDLPQKLKYQMSLQMHKQVAERIKFFTDSDQIFITSIIPLLSPLQLNSFEYVYYKDDIPEEIYFINKGKVSFVYEDRKIVFCSFLSGACFGEIEIVQEVKRKFDAICVWCSTLLTLNAEGIALIKDEFPQVWKKIVTLSDYRDELMKIALQKAEKVFEIRNCDRDSEKSHEEVREMYNQMIGEEVQMMSDVVGAEEKESVTGVLVRKLEEFAEEVKEINLKASIIAEMVREVEEGLVMNEG